MTEGHRDGQTFCEEGVRLMGHHHQFFSLSIEASERVDEVRAGIGKECASIMKAGKLVPLDLTLRLMQNAMEQASDASGYILDGFPRAVNQAKGFTKQVQVTVAQIPSNLLPLS